MTSPVLSGRAAPADIILRILNPQLPHKLLIKVDENIETHLTNFEQWTADSS